MTTNILKQPLPIVITSTAPLSTALVIWNLNRKQEEREEDKEQEEENEGNKDNEDIDDDQQ